MRTLLAYMLILLCSFSAFSQSDKDLKFISVPHPRSENKTQQSVLPGIEKIDFSLYDMTLLGGDLTYYTSINRTSMDYCTQLFNLKSPNTLWTMGNHDLNNRSLIQEYTGRPSYFSYYREGITFVVLDVELDASGLTKSLISGAQLDWLKTISDTISKSDYMLVLHGRLLWMVGNPDFKTRLDSVAESTKQLTTTNFYQGVFPLLQKVKAKGISVICLGGDKSKINIDYSPEDSIHFLASTMAPEYTDDQNNVMVFDYNPSKRKMSWKYVSLTNIEKKKQDGIYSNPENQEQVLKVWQNADLHEIHLCLQMKNNEQIPIRIYSASGQLIQSLGIRPGEIKTVNTGKPGAYIVKAIFDKNFVTDKIIVR